MTPMQAEQYIVNSGRYRRATTPTETVVGFEFPNGRQLALTLRDHVPRVWVEPGAWLSEEVHALFPEVAFYAADQGRHKNIGRNAPRLEVGNAMVKIVVPTIDLLQRLLATYEGEETLSIESYSRPLETQPLEGKALTLKDDGDVAALAGARSYYQKRLHNVLTNEILRILHPRVMKEGMAPGPMYDVLIKNYDDADNDLLIEVKSSVEPAHVRMAVGQLYSYHVGRGAETNEHLAVLVPSQPNSGVSALLSWLDIGLLWINECRLFTSTSWLSVIAKVIDEND